MNRSRLRRLPFLPLALLSLSAGWAGSALLRAVRITPTEESPGGLEALDAVAAVSRAKPGGSALAPALELNPFHPERRRPTQRFLMPGDSVPAASPDSAAVQAQALRLVGTAVVGNGGFAMCQWGTEPPRLVRVGATVNEITLELVAPGRAVFRAAGGKRLELRVGKAGA